VGKTRVRFVALKQEINELLVPYKLKIEVDCNGGFNVYVCENDKIVFELIGELTPDEYLSFLAGLKELLERMIR
jgi:hypothetical protein